MRARTRTSSGTPTSTATTRAPPPGFCRARVMRWKTWNCPSARTSTATGRSVRPRPASEPTAAWRRSPTSMPWRAAGASRRGLRPGQSDHREPVRGLGAGRGGQDGKWLRGRLGRCERERVHRLEHRLKRQLHDLRHRRSDRLQPGAGGGGRLLRRAVRRRRDAGDAGDADQRHNANRQPVRTDARRGDGTVAGGPGQRGHFWRGLGAGRGGQDGKWLRGRLGRCERATSTRSGTPT